MKKIVVFIYPFEKIERIIDYAFRFARPLSLEVEFIHTVETGYVNWDPTLSQYDTANMASPATTGVVVEELVEERQRILRKALSIKKASMNIPVPFTFSVLPGTHVFWSGEIAERNDIEMILVPNSSDKLYDVTAPDLLENSKHPVLAFPLEQDYQPIKKIIYATDFNDREVEIIRNLAGIADKLMASITVFHVSKHKEGYEEELKKAGLEEVLSENISFKTIPVVQERSEKITEGIKEFCKKHNADLIVLMKENKNFFREFFGRSTTRELLKDVDVPVLVYHQ